jgi:hypothetical protein
LHLVVDADTREIAASILTGNDADDAGQVPVLLEQIDMELASITADGAYDGEPVYQAVSGRHLDKPPDVIIPPPRETVAPASMAARRLISMRGYSFTAPVRLET